MSPRDSGPLLRAALLPLAILVLGACATGRGIAADASALPATPVATAAPALASALADLVRADGTLDGTPFDLASLEGHPSLVFFGYTHCPDVCPTTIGELFGVLEARPEARVVFVSIDPERDTPGFLGRWARYFPAGFMALTGSPGAVRRAADPFEVRYARVETSSTAGYAMSHTADVFLLDPEGRLRSAHPFGTPAQDMVADLERLSAG